jgi:ATPase subunit of ABC transporter with duplicated ATPase domains
MNMKNYKKFTMNSMTACLFTIAVITASVPVQAGNWGAFVGGVAAARIVQNTREQNQYAQDQAYYAQQTAQAAQQQATIAQAQASSQPSAESRLDQLNKLAAGGYISPAEYKAKKKEILDSM